MQLQFKGNPSSRRQRHCRPINLEAEYYPASLTAVEVIYLRLLLGDMEFGQKSPTLVYEDNTAWIEWTNNVVGAKIGSRERAKHIDIMTTFGSTWRTKLRRSGTFVSTET